MVSFLGAVGCDPIKTQVFQLFSTPFTKSLLKFSTKKSLFQASSHNKITSSYTPKYVMPSGFKIQGHTPSQEKCDQMMELLTIYAASLVPIQTPIITTPFTQVVVSSS